MSRCAAIPSKDSKSTHFSIIPHNQITAVQDAIQQFNTNVQRIAELQQRSLNAASDGNQQQNNAVLDDLTAQTRDLGNSIKYRIQKLESSPVQPGEDIRMRKTRVRDDALVCALYRRLTLFGSLRSRS